MIPDSAVPSSTYRLQLRREFGFQAAAEVVEYLATLGVGTVYLSPLATARPGSIHGYDVIDPARINPELGTAEDLNALLDKLFAAGLTALFDVVPNHMCIAGDHNAAWVDLLENGPSSPSSAIFDVEWDPPKAELKGKVLLPFLGEQYGRLIEDGFEVCYQDGGLYVAWAATRLPLGSRSWPHVLDPMLDQLRAALGAEDPATLELESILRALTHLPERTDTDPEHGLERRHEKEAIGRRFRALLQLNDASAAGCAAATAALAHALALFNARSTGASEAARLGRLEALMDEQGYRLAHWRVAAHEINYRRFFDVNELGAIRVEDDDVFALVHALPLMLARHPAVCGFRVDHVDGLADPRAYIEQLAHSWGQRMGADPPSAAAVPAPYLVVEKILADGEAFAWGDLCHGTTGYELIPQLVRLFANLNGVEQLSAGLGCQAFAENAYNCKRLVLESTLAAELTMLARRLDKISEQHRHTRDFTLDSLQMALGAVLACFPVYRTYVGTSDPAPAPADRAAVVRAVRAAKRRQSQIHASVFDFIQSVLLLEDPPGLDEAARVERRRFVTRFQQLSGPVMAKGVEDTAFYRQTPLFALAEVGCTPGDFWPRSEDAEGAVHGAFKARQGALPDGLLASSTHDTKRSEDLRARLYGLSEMAPAYLKQLALWTSRHQPLKTALADGSVAPDPSEEQLFYETVLGIWPLDAEGVGRWNGDVGERLCAFMRKARAEAKLHTSWINPNPVYEAAADRFFAALLAGDRPETVRFLAEAKAVVQRLAWPGLWTGLSQLVVKLTAPGVPDVYQGCELLNFTLVDPDNRALVQYDVPRAVLHAVSTRFERDGVNFVDELARRPGDGHLKLFVTHQGLRLRRRHAGLRGGAYLPIGIHGPRADNGFAFARMKTGVDGAAVLVTVVGRHYLDLPHLPTGSVWAGITIDLARALPDMAPDARFRDALTGRVLTLEEAQTLPTVLAHLPVALLERVK